MQSSLWQESDNSFHFKVNSLLKTMVGDYSFSAFIKKLNIDKGGDCDKPQPLFNPN